MRTVHLLVRILIVFVTVTRAASTAHAGQNVVGASDEPAPSSFVLAPAIALTGFGVDTNILAAAEDPKRDLTANVRLQIGPSKRIGPASIRARGAITFAYFQQYAAQRSADTDGALRADLRFNRLALSAAGSTLRTRDTFGPEIDVRVRRLENTVEGGAALRVTSKTWLGAEIGRSQLAINASEWLLDSSLREALDRTVDSVALTARTSLTPLTTVVARFDAERDRFLWWPLRDANGGRLIAGVEFKPTAVIAGKAHVGYRRFVSRDTTQPNVGGVVASVDLTYTAADAVRFGVRAERDLAHSYSLVERYFIWTDLRLSVLRRINRAWDVSGMAGFRRLEYRGAIALTPTAAPPIDHLARFGGAIEYRAGPAATVSVNAEYYRREMGLSGRTYDRLRLVSSIGYRF